MKWLLPCSYNPNLTLLNNHIQNISKGLDFYSSKYDNFIALGDFNAETSDPIISEFCATHNLKNLVKEPTSFKSLKNPTCIDLILTNRPKCFQNSNVFETGLSDFHKLTFTVLKAYFQKQKPKVIKYRNYKKVDNNLFRNNLLNKLLSKNVQTKHLGSFKATAHYIFDTYVPLKEKHVRCNQATFVNKNLKKAIMTSSRLLNKFRQDRTISLHAAYKKQRNICVKLYYQNLKKIFSNNLDVKRVTDNKQFWKTVKPCLGDKILKDERITLTENEKVVSDERELVKIFKVGLSPSFSRHFSFCLDFLFM